MSLGRFAVWSAAKSAVRDETSLVRVAAAGLWIMAAATDSLAAQPSERKAAGPRDTSAVVLTLADTVGNELRLTTRDWAGLPRGRVVLVDSMGRGRAARRTYEGVRLTTLLAVYGLAPEDTAVAGAALRLYVVAEDTAGHRLVFSLAEIEPTIGGHRVLLADRLNGSPLDSAASALWLVAPDDGSRARWLRGLRRLEVRAAPSRRRTRR